MRINRKELLAEFKIVLYGAGLSGKTTTLEEIHKRLSPIERISEVIKETATHNDRTIWFDMMPINRGKFGNYRIKHEIFTVPGQIHYHNTRKLVLSGADGIVFVADSQPELRESNLAIMKEMFKHLEENKIKPMEIPLLLQFNKRDLPNIMSVEQMYEDLARPGKRDQYVETSAITGANVMKVLQLITGMTEVSKSKPAQTKEEVKIGE